MIVAFCCAPVSPAEALTKVLFTLAEQPPDLVIATLAVMMTPVAVAMIVIVVIVKLRFRWAATEEREARVH